MSPTPPSRSDREFRISLNNLHCDGASPFFPRAVRDRTRYHQGASVCSLAALQWAWDTNELGRERIICDRYDRVAMAAHIDELHMGREVWVRLHARSSYISSLRILQARSHAMPQQNVDRRLRVLIVGSLS